MKTSTAQPWYFDRLACPTCRSPLPTEGGNARCPDCGFVTQLTERPIALVSRAPEPMYAELPRAFCAMDDLGELSLDPPPEVAPHVAKVRDSRTLFSALATDGRNGGDLLDLGCGPRDQAEPTRLAGYRYVGVDLFDDRADLRADAHSLPFRDESFDVVLAYAVLEHLHNPCVAMHEIRRVLRPGGIFVGTVSQGEPFHASYFHWTAWGLAAEAQATGLHLLRLWPSRDTLLALAEMGRYSRPTRLALQAVALLERRLPFLAPRRWLRWSRRDRQIDSIHRAGSLCFSMRREAPPSDD